MGTLLNLPFLCVPLAPVAAADAAPGPRLAYQGRLVGTQGDCGIFSFTESKTITTGEGGMLITDDLGIAETARLVRNHGEVILDGQTQRTYTSTMLGWMYENRSWLYCCTNGLRLKSSSRSIR